GDVFAHRGDGFTGDHAAADGGLDGDLEHVAVDFLAQLLDQLAAAEVGELAKDDRRKCVDAFAVHQNIESHEIGGAIAGDLVVHGAVAAGGGFELVVKIVDD